MENIYIDPLSSDAHNPIQNYDTLIERMCSVLEYEDKKREESRKRKQNNIKAFKEIEEKLSCPPSKAFEYFALKAINDIPFGSTEYDNIVNDLTEEERNLLKL